MAWEELDLSRLSVREREVAKLIAEGKNAKEISEIMGITPKTAKRYRDLIIEKLNLRGNAHPSVLVAVGYILEKKRGRIK